MHAQSKNSRKSLLASMTDNFFLLINYWHIMKYIVDTIYVQKRDVIKKRETWWSSPQTNNERNFVVFKTGFSSAHWITFLSNISHFLTLFSSFFLFLSFYSLFSLFYAHFGLYNQHESIWEFSIKHF